MESQDERRARSKLIHAAAAGTRQLWRRKPREKSKDEQGAIKKSTSRAQRQGAGTGTTADKPQTLRDPPPQPTAEQVSNCASWPASHMYTQQSWQWEGSGRSSARANRVRPSKGHSGNAVGEKPPGGRAQRARRASESEISADAGMAIRPTREIEQAMKTAVSRVRRLV